MQEIRRTNILIAFKKLDFNVQLYNSFFIKYMKAEKCKACKVFHKNLCLSVLHSANTSDDSLLSLKCR